MSRPGSAIEITVTDRSGDSTLDADRWAAVARHTLRAEGVTGGELGLSFVAADEMAAINREHMDASGPTDVLAFPMDADDGVHGLATREVSGGSDVPVLLGDVVVCPEVARAQTPGHCGTFPAEMALLVIHGVLHVLGHDHYHEDDKDLMQSRERLHMEHHGFTHPEPGR